MKRTLATVLTAAAALSVAGSAAAQQFPQLPWPFGQPQPQQQPYAGPYGDRSGPGITFYEGENFTGRAVTVFGVESDFTRLGFNDRARSAQANGSFVVCEDIEFRGRCERVTGSVRSLDRIGMGGRISSARDERGGYGGGYDDDDRDDRDGYGRGGGYGSPRRDGVQGRSVTFFSRPNVGGNDVAARGQNSADQFCRASGYGAAVYYSQGERSRRAADTDGRVVDAPILRDVLCRNR